MQRQGELVMKKNFDFSVSYTANGQKYTSFVCTAKNVVLEILDKIKADKVAVFAVSANYTIINGAKAYKVINTPLRVD